MMMRQLSFFRLVRCSSSFIFISRYCRYISVTYLTTSPPFILSLSLAFSPSSQWACRYFPVSLICFLIYSDCPQHPLHNELFVIFMSLSLLCSLVSHPLSFNSLAWYYISNTFNLLFLYFHCPYLIFMQNIVSYEAFYNIFYPYI